MQPQCDVQSLNVDAALLKDPELAVSALCMDPLAPPSESACRNTFEEMKKLQGDVWGL